MDRERGRTGRESCTDHGTHGHASSQASLVYRHATADRDRLIADRLVPMAEEAGLAVVVPIRASRTGSGQ